MFSSGILYIIAIYLKHIVAANNVKQRKILHSDVMAFAHSLTCLDTMPTIPDQDPSTFSVPQAPSRGRTKPYLRHKARETVSIILLIYILINTLNKFVTFRKLSIGPHQTEMDTQRSFDKILTIIYLNVLWWIRAYTNIHRQTNK